MHDDEKVTYFAETDARNKRIRFGIKAKDRARHVYAIGKTGMGKSTLLENLAIQDILNGEGVAFVDPHGKSADMLLEYIPEHRKKDVVYFAPFDLDFPIAFNVLEDVDITKRYLVANGLMSAFKTIWADAFSARMEYILNNIMLALLEYPGSTLMSVNRMLTDKDFRSTVVANVTDPTVKAFWIDEYGKYTEKFAAEAAPAIQNKVGQFVGNPLVRNIIGQPVSGFDIREIMDNKKILIINLSKGRVGEANANLLGAMLITKIYLAAMSRADLKEDELKKTPQFYLYVDEFQNFANETFADILSEARKYKLSLTIANQYVEQMPEEVRAAVFGNVGTMITFRIGAYDASVFEKEYAPEFTAEDLVNLQQYQMYLKLMIDGVTSRPFSAIGMAPIPKPEISYVDEIINFSRSQFANPREKVEEEIRNWHVEKIGAKEPVKKSADKASDTERPRGEARADTRGGTRDERPERSNSRSDSRSNTVDNRPNDRPAVSSRSAGVGRPSVAGRPSIRSDRFDRAPEESRSRKIDNRPRIDNGFVEVDGSEKKSEKYSNPVPVSSLNTPLPSTSNSGISYDPVASPSLNQTPKPTHVINRVSLNTLNNNFENKIKNNQKDIKPENAAALRSALLSVMGDIPSNNKADDTTTISESKIVKEDVKESTEIRKDLAKEKAYMFDQKTGSLTPDDLKRILDIEQ
jgi:Type IV secretion-system coupling protein DNA-binding domain